MKPMWTLDVDVDFEMPSNAPAEGAYFDFSDGPRLIIYLDSPTDNEVEAIRLGKARFALARYGRVLFVLAKFGDMPWMDAPYSIQLLPSEARLMPEGFRPGLRYACGVSVQDLRTGSTLGARFVTLDVRFSELLHNAVAKQLEQEIDRATYERDIAHAYTLYPSPRAMLSIAMAECKGGT